MNLPIQCGTFLVFTAMVCKVNAMLSNIYIKTLLYIHVYMSDLLPCDWLIRYFWKKSS